VAAPIPLLPPVIRAMGRVLTHAIFAEIFVALGYNSPHWGTIHRHRCTPMVRDVPQERQANVAGTELGQPQACRRVSPSVTSWERQ
jgi:hypothetical protein